MTTQVVLLNGLGIALASDSAVTSGGKVLNTSEKVFELSTPHKVAVLASGRADLMGHPWEVLLSAWSETVLQPLSSMNEYRNSLYSFLRSRFPSTPEMSEHEIDYFNSNYWNEEDGVFPASRKSLEAVLVPFYEELLPPEDLEVFMRAEWDEEFRDRMSALLTPEILSRLDEEFQAVIDRRKARFEPADDISYAQSMIWVEKYWAHWDNLRPSDNFSSWPHIPNLDRWVKELSSVSLVHANYSGESNINFVGYGANDLFPSASGVFFHGQFSGIIIKRFEGALESSAEPRHVTFGQDDAINALTKGEDYLLTRTAVEATRQTLNDIYEQLSEATDEESQKTREYVRQSLETDTISDEMKRAGNERRLKPFTKAIAMSPILDLAEFAAQLVGVQAASAAMTQENPSVGGFVDVAIITHRRGFEWIRHKH